MGPLERWKLGREGEEMVSFPLASLELKARERKRMSTYTSGEESMMRGIVFMLCL